MTIKDLSAQTGYSVGTISRVLNNQPNVSEKARKAILAAAEKSGFQLNINAKMLKQQHSNTILAVVKGTSNQLFGTLMEAVQTLVAQTPYALMVDYLDEDCNEVVRAVQLCREKKPLGILFLGGNRENFLSDFSQIQVPAVLITNTAQGLDFPNLSSVTCDDRLSAELAVEELLKLGHRKIGIIGGDRIVSDITKNRYRGCVDAFEKYGVSFEPELGYIGVRFSYADGYRAARQLLRQLPDMTAVFAMSDVMAIGAIRALQDHGKRVPEDVSVMGYDGVALGEFIVPRLTTVSQSPQELAAKSVEILCSQIEGEPSARHETIPAAVQCKESVQKIL